MGSVGDAFDNAVIDSFWAACKPNRSSEELKTAPSRANAIFDYL